MDIKTVLPLICYGCATNQQQIVESTTPIVLNCQFAMYKELRNLSEAGKISSLYYEGLESGEEFEKDAEMKTSILKVQTNFLPLYEPKIV